MVSLCSSQEEKKEAEGSEIKKESEVLVENLVRMEGRKKDVEEAEMRVMNSVEGGYKRVEYEDDGGR